MDADFVVVLENALDDIRGDEPIPFGAGQSDLADFLVPAIDRQKGLKGWNAAQGVVDDDELKARIDGMDAAAGGEDERGVLGAVGFRLGIRGLGFAEESTALAGNGGDGGAFAFGGFGIRGRTAGENEGEGDRGASDET